MAEVAEGKASGWRQRSSFRGSFKYSVGLELPRRHEGIASRDFEKLDMVISNHNLARVVPQFLQVPC